MFKGVHPLFIILIICTIITIISEFASNVASIQLALPILISLQQALQLPPLLLLLPATLAASLGFMLPVATAPNTIVFSSGQIKVREMAKAGILVNISGIIIITVICYLLLV
jgi:sodium-dependent dicarboxylate transporter 2/3/5